MQIKATESVRQVAERIAYQTLLALVSMYTMTHNVCSQSPTRPRTHTIKTLSVTDLAP